MTEKIRLPRILVTNDDGYDAPGLSLLTEIAADFADEVWVVAPEHDQSGVSMKISLHTPLRVYPKGARSFAVSGTPVDCVALACHHLMKDEPPQLLLSGINAGQNCGDDVNLSGTVNAAMIGLMFGIPSIAVSQACASRREIDWEIARTHLPAVLHSILHHGWRKETCLSVNLPDADPDSIHEIAWTRQSHRTINGVNVETRTDLRDGTYHWLELTRNPPEFEANTETAALKRNQVTITCLSLDRSVSPGRQIVPLYPEADLHVGT